MKGRAAGSPFFVRCSDEILAYPLMATTSSTKVGSIF